MKTLKNLLQSEEGATAIEYALIAALISIVAIAALGRGGTQVNSSFSRVASSLTSANR